MATSDEDLTVWIGGLDARVTTEILWELFVQAGPLADVRLPVDKETGQQRPYAFIAFKHAVSGPYAERLFNGIQLFDKTIRVRYKGTSKFDQDQYHELYEKLLDRLVVDNPSKYAGIFEEIDRVKASYVGQRISYDQERTPSSGAPPPHRQQQSPYEQSGRRSYGSPHSGHDRSFYNDRYNSSDSRHKGGSGYGGGRRSGGGHDDSYYRQRGSRF